jgi:hypothetical protein
LWYILAVLISISCITTGAHSLLDVAAGVCTFFIIRYRHHIWSYLLQKAETLSQNRRKVRSGSLRKIEIAFFWGAELFAGALLSGFFLGGRHTIAVFSVITIIIAGDYLVAKIVKQYPEFLKASGFYTLIAGGIVSCLFTSFVFSVDFFSLLGAFAMAAPWVRAISNFRCLVAGSDHYQAQLYSAGANIITGLVLIAIFNLGVSSSFIAGIYLILFGTARFIENPTERGDQLLFCGRRKIYNWTTVLFILTGIIFTCISNSACLVFEPDLLSLILSAGAGIILIIVMGINFPAMNRNLAPR